MNVLLQLQHVILWHGCHACHADIEIVDPWCPYNLRACLSMAAADKLDGCADTRWELFPPSRGRSRLCGCRGRVPWQGISQLPLNRASLPASGAHVLQVPVVGRHTKLADGILMHGVVAVPDSQMPNASRRATMGGGAAPAVLR